MKALFYTLFLLAIVAIALFLTKEYWHKYYQKCFEPTKISKFKPRILIQEPELETISSERKLKHALADSDFIIYPKKITLIAIKNSAMLEVWEKKMARWSISPLFHLVHVPVNSVQNCSKEIIRYRKASTA